MELTIYNANAFEVKIDNGRDAYVEMQEHCALISTGMTSASFSALIMATVSFLETITSPMKAQPNLCLWFGRMVML